MENITFRVNSTSRGTGEYSLPFVDEDGDEHIFRLNVYEMSSLEDEFKGKKRDLGINWSCYGTMSAKNSKLFAEFLLYVVNKINQ